MTRSSKPKQPPTSLAKKSKRKTKKSVAVTSDINTQNTPDGDAAPLKRRFGPRRRASTPHVKPAKLPNVVRISKKSFDLLARHGWLFAGIVAIYGALNLVLVRGFSGFVSLSLAKEVISGGNFEKGMALFGELLQSSGQGSSDAVGIIQSCLLVITSLAIVWSLRQVMAGEQIRIRDAFYKGMYPLVPVLLVGAVILLEFLPLIIGGFLYALVVGNGIAKNLPEIIPWAVVYFLGLLLTLYLLTTSIIALYIATLPDMTPINALRSANKLVRYRRWSVLRKLVFLPFAMMLVTVVIMLPILLWLTPLASWVFFVLSMLGIVVIHAYLYTLYRELLA